MDSKDNESYLKQYYWDDKGSITVAQALLGASALTHAAVKALAIANKVLIEIPQGWVAAELRFYSDSAADTEDILEIYTAATSDSLPDHYRHIAQLTNLVGTQVRDGSNKFIDTIVPVTNWLTKNEAISPANNTFGSYVMNVHGYSHILVIASTLNSTTLSVEIKKV